MTFKGYPNLLGSDSDRTMRRDEQVYKLTTSPQQVLGPNARRVGLIMGFQQPAGVNPIQQDVLAPGVDATTTGVKATLTAPTGYYTVVTGFGKQSNGSFAFRALLVRSSTTLNVIAYTATANQLTQCYIPLAEGDKFELSQDATSTGTCDWGIYGFSLPWIGNATVTFRGSGSSTYGFTLTSGSTPLVIWRDVVGDAICEGAWAYSGDGVSNNMLSVVDLFT